MGDFRLDRLEIRVFRKHWLREGESNGNIPIFLFYLLRLSVANQALLYDRRDQFSLLIEKITPIEPTTAGSGGTVQRVQQPFVDFKIIVEPHGVVQAGHLHKLLVELRPVGQQGCPHQIVIGGVRQNFFI